MFDILFSKSLALLLMLSSFFQSNHRSALAVQTTSAIGFDLLASTTTLKEDSGEWSMYYLDRLEVSCLDDPTTAINQFQIQLNPDPTVYEWWYSFTCVTAGFNATTTQLSQMVAYDDANRQDNVEWLDRIGTVDCSSVGGVMSQFKMVNTEDPDENGYAFTCSTFGDFSLTSCRTVSNIYSSVGSSKGSANNANYLSLQNVECEANEAIQSFRYQDTYPEATGGYEYVCCQYNPSCSPGFGYIPEMGTCSQCYAGTYSPGGISSCLVCESGYTSLDMASSCYYSDVAAYSEDESAYEAGESVNVPNYESENKYTDDDWYYYLSKTIDADSSCNWIDGSTGVAFDLLPLMVINDTKKSYSYEHTGDVSSYNYVWNVCAEVTSISLPTQCYDKMSVMENHIHAVYQYKGDDECYVLGKFFYQKNFTYSLIDSTNPAKGISLTYEKGEKCNAEIIRDSVIDIYCSNVEVAVQEAKEPRTCSYHMVMESYYGCPTTCAVTAKGLCDSAGTCVYDPEQQYAYCKCDYGFGDNDCSKLLTTFDTVTSYIPYYYTSDYHASSVTWGQIVVIVLVSIFAFALCAVLGFLGFRHLNWRRNLGYSVIPQKDEFLMGSMNL